MRRRPIPRFRPVVDGLDRRLLPAAGVTAGVVGGVLTIAGTDAADEILVTVRPAPGRRWGGVAQVLVTLDGVRPFRPTRVRSIVIAAGAGDDRIVINGAGRVRVPAWIDAGAGDDTVLGGGGDDTILGGAGDDALWGGGGRNAYDGGAGRDLVDGVPLAQPGAAPASPPGAAPESPPGAAPESPSAAGPTRPNAAVPAVAPAAPRPGPAAPDAADQLVDLVNRERVAAGLGAVSVNPLLAQAAQLHADNMARLDRMEHDLEGAEQPTLASRAAYVGYRYSWLGENIAYNFPDAGNVHFAWMNSPGHRANILNAQFTEMGVGLARNARGEWYYCEVFGRPA